MRSKFAGGCLRGFLTLLPLMLPTLLLAQGEGWTEFLATWRRTNHAPATLLVPKDRLTSAYARSDEPILFLTTTGDLGTQSLDGSLLDSLRAARGWKGGPH